MAQIKDFRTKAFRNKVSQIATLKGWVKNNPFTGLKFNMDSKGNVKRLKIDGVEDVYVAYIEVKDLIIRKNGVEMISTQQDFIKALNNNEVDTSFYERTYTIGITLSEYLSFNRDSKLENILN